MKSFLDNYYGDDESFQNTKPAVKILEKAINEIIDFKFYHFSSEDVDTSHTVTRKLLQIYKRNISWYDTTKLIFGLIPRYNIPFLFSTNVNKSTPESACIVVYYNDIIIYADIVLGLFFNTYSNISIIDAKTDKESWFSTKAEISTFQPFNKTLRRIICKDDIEKINNLYIRVEL